MDSNMKERNVKEAWSAYEEDGKKLMAEAIKKRDVVLKKYENRVKIYSLFDASSCRIVSRFATSRIH